MYFISFDTQSIVYIISKILRSRYIASYKDTGFGFAPAPDYMISDNILAPALCYQSLSYRTLLCP